MNTPDTHAMAVVIERTFAAPVELVWHMWTDPAAFATWYGPDGATIPVCEMDLQVDGRRRVCMAMETPMGTREMWFTGTFLEIVEPVRIVYTEAMTDPDGNPLDGPHSTPTEVTVEFTDLAGATRVLLTHRGIPAGSPGETGWQLAFDKLHQRLAEH